MKLLNDPKIKSFLLSNKIYNVRPWCWDKLISEKEFGNVKILHAHHLNNGFLTKLKRKLKYIK